MQYRNWRAPEYIHLSGQFVTLKPLVPERDVDRLYSGTHGTPEKEAVWIHVLHRT